MALLAVGALFMATAGRRLLPVRQSALQIERSENPSEVYRLHERLFSIRLPERSPLDGRSLGETRLGSALGVQVVAIVRAGGKQLAPEAKTQLRAGDVLLVQGASKISRSCCASRVSSSSARAPTRSPNAPRGSADCASISPRAPSCSARPYASCVFAAVLVSW
ncbi:MAG: hypothetical protein HC897_04845 [Thermoanaerobaculia bacterium]|nr:hypothetical protein [Thermoanaerobaculia bacterium]